MVVREEEPVPCQPFFQRIKPFSINKMRFYFFSTPSGFIASCNLFHKPKGTPQCFTYVFYMLDIFET